MKRLILYATAFLSAMSLTGVGGDPFDLTWNTIDGGGAMRSASANGEYELSGTIGQPDAGVLTGGAFTLTGGFWFEMPPGDCNGNGIRDLGDHADFINCMSGPADNVGEECRCFDTDGTGTVDLRDFKKTQGGAFAP